MTAALLSPPAMTWRFALQDPAVRRRAGAYAAAGALHAVALALLLMVPPGAYDPVRRAVNAVEVRLYTVAGGADAQTDAPLYEPPIAVDPSPQDGVAAAGSAPARVEPPAEDRMAEPAAVDPATEPARETDDTGAPVSELAADTPEPAAPGAERLGGEAASAPPPPRGSAVRDPGAPVATTQIDPPERAAVAAARPPSFADILARAESRLDPADSQVAQLLGGVRGAARESFCLSSASGNRDAMDCPDEPNAASAQLARYGLMGLGEVAPEFHVDMNRLEYQLRTLGADDNAVTRILTALREARREAINTAPMLRQMSRDQREGGVDNLGNPRMGAPMPDDPGG
ncbi:MAG: hypothetical protein ACFE0P_00055 [Oceanicaulis sp.]